MEQASTDIATVTPAVHQQAFPERAASRTSLRQNTTITVSEGVANIVDTPCPVETNKIPGRIHQEAEIGNSVTIYPMYLKSLVGVLKVVQVVISVIVCVTADISQCVTGILCGSPSSPMWYGVLSGQGFVMFVPVLLIVANVLLIGYHLLKKPSINTKSTDWFRLGELIYDIVAAGLFMLAGSVQAWYASWMTLHVPNARYMEEQIVWNPYRPQWIASSIFAWINVLIYAADAVCTFFFDPGALRGAQIGG